MRAYRGLLATAARRAGVEAAAAFFVSVFLACASHLHTFLHPASTVPKDLGDPLLQAWELAWDGHAVLEAHNVFDANVFYPLENTLGFTDSLLGYLPFGLLGHGQSAAIFRYNVVFLFAWALCCTAAYLLARQLGLRHGGAMVAGVVFGFAPWRVEQSGHLQILSSGGIVLALALLARGHGIRWSRNLDANREWRSGIAFLGWCTAAWQLSLGFGIGLQSAYLLGGVTVILLGRAVLTGMVPAVPRIVWIADLLGMGVFLTVLDFFAQPYLRAVHDHPEGRRTLTDLNLFSPPWYGFLTPPSQSGLLGGNHVKDIRDSLPDQPEMAFGLGITAVVLAVAGAVYGGGGLRGWSLRRRTSLVVLTLFLLVLACGTTLGGAHSPYVLLLFNTLPGWQGVRTPGRIAVSASVGVALLAGLGAQAAGRAVQRWVASDRPRLSLAVTGVLTALILAEGWNTTPAVAPRPPLSAMNVPAGPTLVLPSDDYGDAQVMLWTTETFDPVVNGWSGFDPTTTSELRQETADFPSPGAVAALRHAGVRRVVIDVERAKGTALGQRTSATDPGLGMTRTDLGDSIVYMLA